MSNSNRKLRITLASIFGNTCMFKKSRAEEFIEKLGTIKTYKQYKIETHYKSRKIKKLESLKTLHHLVHRSERRKNYNSKWSNNKYIST